MRYALVILSLLALAACGADGEPERPTAQTTISGGTNGVILAQTLRQGPLTVRLGMGT
ncbi:MAG: hypothetical protein P1U53_18005 [Sulfitobacter sp.]|nr:hypothetical protein [Sulfitobacter sp.]